MARETAALIDPKSQRLFGILIIFQMAHSIEEYTFELYNVFAPARFASAMPSAAPSCTPATSQLRPSASSWTGRMLVSGPTENALYRLGRRIAGFDGHYHKVTIYDVERALAERLECLCVQRVPLTLPLFRLSVWKRR